MLILLGFLFNVFTCMIALILLASLLKISLLIIGVAVAAWMVYEIIIAPLIEEYEDERDL